MATLPGPGLRVAFLTMVTQESHPLLDSQGLGEQHTKHNTDKPAGHYYQPIVRTYPK